MSSRRVIPTEAWGGAWAPWPAGDRAWAAGDRTWAAGDRPFRRRRVQLSLQELRELGYPSLDWVQLSRPNLPLYIPKQLRQIIREGGTVSARGDTPLLNPRKYPPDVILPWHLPDITQIQMETRPVPAAPAHIPPAAPWWEAATRGWALGALILVLIILIVRMTEKCVDGQFFKFTGRSRRRQSVEWPAPTVLATRHRQTGDVNIAPGPEESDAFSSESNMNSVICDLPPPYYACAGETADADNVNKNVSEGNSISNEEPPPPYSACYVGYTHSKDGIPAVHFYNRQRQKVTGERSECASTSNGNIQIAEASNSSCLQISHDSTNVENEAISCKALEENTETTHNENNVVLEVHETNIVAGTENDRSDLIHNIDGQNNDTVTRTDQTSPPNNVMLV